MMRGKPVNADDGSDALVPMSDDTFTLLHLHATLPDQRSALPAPPSSRGSPFLRTTVLELQRLWYDKEGEPGRRASSGRGETSMRAPCAPSKNSFRRVVEESGGSRRAPCSQGVPHAASIASAVAGARVR